MSHNLACITAASLYNMSDYENKHWQFANLRKKEIFRKKEDTSCKGTQSLV